jgi:hypothetical protein
MMLLFRTTAVDAFEEALDDAVTALTDKAWEIDNLGDVLPSECIEDGYVSYPKVHSYFYGLLVEGKMQEIRDMMQAIDEQWEKELAEEEEEDDEDSEESEEAETAQ